MTIEEECNKIIDKHYPIDRLIDVEEWAWFETPGSTQRHPSASYSKVLKEIDELLKQADSTECLTSKSEYIRECKKWFMERE